jgi:hypothetical protein
MGDWVQPAINIRNLRVQVPYNRINRSSWFITIGTHKKPASEREFEILRVDLEEVLNEVLTDPTFANWVLYNMGRNAETGRWHETNKANWMRTDRELKIVNQSAEFIVERGQKQGRIDAHILWDVEHVDTRLQFDNKVFQDLINDAIAARNVSFQQRNIMSDDPAKAGRTLEWANPPVYVWWRAVARNDNNPLVRYMVKQNDTEITERFQTLDQVMSGRDAEAGRAREDAEFEEIWRELNG